MAVTAGHLVAGFGRIRWLGAADLLYEPAPAAALSAREADILQHMNEDHAEAVGLYARRLLSLEGEGWVLTGIDPEGIDLRNDERLARIAFTKPVHDAEGARAALVSLARDARGRNEDASSA